MPENPDPAAQADTASDVVVKTPPPATEEKAGKASWGFILTSLVVGAAVGYGIAHTGLELFATMSGWGWKIGLVASLPLVLFAVIGWHEFGHVVGGWMVGGRFVLWCVGPIKLQRTPAGLQWGLNTSVNLMGGLAVCVPLDAARTTPTRIAVMTLAGPGASLLLAMAALAPIFLHSTAGDSAPSLVFAHNLALITGGVSGLIFLATIFPGTAGGFKTDGKRARDLLIGGPRSDHEAALLLLSTAGLAGTRPADYDATLVQQAISLRDGSLFDRYGCLSAYYHFADRGEWIRAQEMLDYILLDEAQLAPFVRHTVRNEYAWLLATQTNGIAAARAWLDSAGPTEFEPATRLRAEAAVRLAEGDPNGAAIKVEAGLYALKHRSLTPTINRFAEDALLNLRKAAEADQGSS